MKNAVVIIAYSPTPSEIELVSFSQCLKILFNHDIIVACPNSLNTDIYDSIIQNININVLFIKFDDSFFTSVASYNKLMKSIIFYEHFLKYNYILIYQLDAFVFKDELNLWCNKNYDYIGAPWYTDKGKILKSAGNGGFSLRKVSTFYNLLSGKYEKSFLNKIIFFFNIIVFYLKEFDFYRFTKSFYLILKCRFNILRFVFYYTDENEDYSFYRFFTFYPITHIPESKEAISFSFERFPEDLYVKNNHELPFGCHAFNKYNPKFWSQFIPEIISFNKEVTNV